MSAVAGGLWYLLKPGGKERMVLGTDNSTNVDDSTKVMTVDFGRLTFNLGPLIQVNAYVASNTIIYNQSYSVEGRKPINYGIHLIDAMVQWRQGYDNELIQGPLMEVWSKEIIQPVQDRVKSAHAVICVGVADEVGSDRRAEEGLASRRGANLEKVATRIRGSEQRIHSLNLGQWLKKDCPQRDIDWNNQRRLVFITIDDEVDESDYQSYVRDAADRLRNGLRDRTRLSDNPELERLLKDNETLMDMYLNCYSRSGDWTIV